MQSAYPTQQENCTPQLSEQLHIPCELSSQWQRIAGLTKAQNRLMEESTRESVRHKPGNQTTIETTTVDLPPIQENEGDDPTIAINEPPDWDTQETETNSQAAPDLLPRTT